MSMKNINQLTIILIIVSLIACQKKINSDSKDNYLRTLNEMKSTLTEGQIDSLRSDILLIMIVEPSGMLGNTDDNQFFKELNKRDDQIAVMRQRIHGLSYKQIKERAKNLKEKHVNNLQKENQKIKETNKIFTQIQLDSIKYIPLSLDNKDFPKLTLKISNKSNSKLSEISGTLFLKRNSSIFFKPKFDYKFKQPLNLGEKLAITIVLNDEKQNSEANLYLDGSPSLELTFIKDSKGNEIEKSENDIIPKSNLDFMLKLSKLTFAGYELI